SVNVWKAFPDAPLILPRETMSSYRATAFTSGNELLAVGITGDYHIKLWNLTKGQELSDFSSRGQDVLCAVFSREAKMFAVSGIDDFVKIRRADTGEVI